MVSNERFMPVPPEAVWDAIADPTGYAYWVVGSKEVREVDDDWPAEGSRFHHTIGIGPLKVADHTEIVTARRPEVFELRAKARPFGTARVELQMTPDPDGEGTTVVMTEHPDGPFAFLSLNPATHAFTLVRNAETLMRLEELALLQDGQTP